MPSFVSSTSNNLDLVKASNVDFSGPATEPSNTITTNGQLIIGSTALNAGGTHINIGVLTSPDGSITIGYASPNITLRATNGFLISWIDQGTSTTGVVNTGYFATAAITLTLPLAPSQGNVVAIDCDTTGSVVVQANAGQTIRLGNTASSVAGTATNTARGDCLVLVYRSSNSTWQTISSMGNWTLA